MVFIKTIWCEKFLFVLSSLPNCSFIHRTPVVHHIESRVLRRSFWAFGFRCFSSSWLSRAGRPRWEEAFVLQRNKKKISISYVQFKINKSHNRLYLSACVVSKHLHESHQKDDRIFDCSTFYFSSWFCGGSLSCPLNWPLLCGSYTPL